MKRSSSRRTPDYSGETFASWMEHPVGGTFPALDQDVSTQVCVIGAGIAGLTAAYLLAMKGRRVVVVDLGAVGGGETSRTTAHIVTAIDDRYERIATWRGEEAARLAAESQLAAIEMIVRNVAEERIDCELTRVDGYLFAPPGESSDELEKELEAARAAGLSDVALVDRAPLPSFDTGRALRFPRQAQFHPLMYLESLTGAIVREGGRIYSHTRIEEIDSDGLVATTAEGRKIRAEDIVIATNAPIFGPASNDVMQAPYRTFVIAADVPSGAVPAALYWDTAWPYHYVRLQQGADRASELLVVGGEDHKTGQADDAEDRWSRLESWARERFPAMRDVRYRWSGQVQETVDGLGLIGRQKEGERVYQITGDSGIGMTNGTIGAMLVTDLILKSRSPWTELYDPGRKPVRSVGELVKEGANVAAQIVKRVLPARVKSADDIPADSGAVVETDGSKSAVYRDAGGELHERSAICPHRGCLLAWNSAEKTWDCPCHGSRFDRYGKVVTAPARGDMAAAVRKEEARRR